MQFTIYRERKITPFLPCVRFLIIFLLTAKLLHLLSLLIINNTMLRFMKNKILIPLVVIGVLGAFFSFKYGGGDGQTNEEKKVLILETVMKTIKEGHYSPRPVDDSFSYR